MAGIAATADRLVVADRDALDSFDVFRCLDSATGAALWSYSAPASGKLDYGNAPRATPLVHGEHVFVYNAFGKLTCLRLVDGRPVWSKDLLREFQGADPTNAWGACSSPLIVDGLLIVNPGGPEAAVAALRPGDGQLVWKTPGEKAAFSSFIVATLGGRRQLVGYERDSLCGYDTARGTRLWKLVPPRRNDFNVPTPLAVEGRLLVTTENNGTRLYDFDAQGRIVETPRAASSALASDMQSPVVAGGRVFGISGGLHCLDLADGLRPVWESLDRTFDDYASAIGCGDRVLLFTAIGELILLDARADEFRPLARYSILDESGIYSHPALVGARLFVRGVDSIVCLDLAPRPQ